MIRKMTLTICLLAGCVWCAALVITADAAQPASQRGFEPVASVDALMHGQLVFFKQINKNLRKASNPDALHEVEEAAQVLAELANVNRFNSEKADYRKWATELRDNALSLAGEADKGADSDTKEMKKIVQQMKATCGACHDKYQE